MKISGKKITSAIIILVILLVSSVYLWALNSDAYKFSVEYVRSSSLILGEVGKVESVDLSFVSGFRERITTDGRAASMTLDVVGKRKSIKLRIDVQKGDGDWRVIKARTDDGVISINDGEVK